MMKQKVILLVEDDFLNRRLTRKILSENAYRVLEAKNVNEALLLLQKEPIDLAILDIHLGENQQDGISLGLELTQNYALPFIYLTAYDTTDIVSKAVATTPYAYITKPFKHIDLITSIELAIRQSSQVKKRSSSILVKDGEFNVDLPLAEINYIESDGNYLLLHAEGRVYKNRSTIKQILEILPKQTFVQTHRAYVVNKNKISKFNSKNLWIQNAIIPISKNYISDMSIFCNHAISC